MPKLPLTYGMQLLNITCTLVATSVTLRSLECTSLGVRHNQSRPHVASRSTMLDAHDKLGGQSPGVSIIAHKNHILLAVSQA